MEKALVKDIIQWDIKSWSNILNYWDKHIDWNKIDTGLELGSREGGLSLWLALKNKKVICSDLENVEKTAKQLHIRYNVTSLIQYQDLDATHIPYENYFDIVVFKSIIGGIGRNNNIENQQKVFNQIYKALKPGGKLLFAENLVGSPLHKILRKHFVKWGNSWRYVSINEMNLFLKDFSNYQIHTNGVLAAFGRSEMQRNCLSLVDKALLNHICPKSWKYICYGIAEK
jgi:SAM-dependent methyltransferase